MSMNISNLLSYIYIETHLICFYGNKDISKTPDFWTV